MSTSLIESMSPTGRILQLWGPTGSGKTHVCLAMAADTLKAGGTVGWIDIHAAFLPYWARALGIDLESDRFDVFQVMDLSETVVIAKALLAAGVNLVVIDGVESCMTPPGKETLDDIWRTHLAEISSLLSTTGTTFVGTLSTHTGWSGAAVQKVGVEPAWKVYSSSRISLARGSTPGSYPYTIHKGPRQGETGILDLGMPSPHSGDSL